MDNYLLFVPSLMNERSKQRTYSIDGWDGSYSGTQTNEAMTKYLIDYLNRQGEHFTKIVMLCTREVQMNRLALFHNQTTLEYYCSSISEYLQKHTSMSPEEAEKIFEVIPYDQAGNEDVDQILKPLEKILFLTMGENEPGRNKLYVDFTGGVRTTALTLLFACRILNTRGVEVERILYSNLSAPNSDQGKIEECSNTYHVFDLLAVRLERRYGGTDSVENFSRSLKGRERELIEELVEKVKDVQAAKDQHNAGKAVQSARAVKQAAEKAVREVKDPNAKKISENELQSVKRLVDSDEDPNLVLIEDYLSTHSNSAAMNLFREKIVGILLESGILKAGERFAKGGTEEGKINETNVANEFFGAYRYYVGFQETVSGFLEYLKADPSRSPQDVWDEKYGDRFFKLSAFSGDIPRFSFPHNSFSRRQTQNAVMPYIKRKYKNGADIKRCIEEYDRLDRLYTGHGFPFACTYNNCFLEGYDRIYKDCLESGIRSLTALYEGRVDASMRKVLEVAGKSAVPYEELIAMLTDDGGMQRKLFPFRMNEKNISSERITGDEWDEFAYNFTRSFDIVRKARNKSEHPEKLSLSKEEEQEALAEMSSVISTVRKYSQISGK